MAVHWETAVTNASLAALHALSVAASSPPSTALVPLRQTRARHERDNPRISYPRSLPSAARRCRCALAALRYTLRPAAASLPPVDRRPKRFLLRWPSAMLAHHAVPFCSAHPTIRTSASATQCETSVTNVRCVPPTGLLVVSLCPFRPRPFCYTLRPFVTGPLCVLTADAAASVCGPAAALRCDSVPLNAALRLRSTSPACRHADRSCSLHHGHLLGQAHYARSCSRIEIRHPSLSIRDPTASSRDQRALRFADRAIGRSPVSLPTTPDPLHFARVRHEDNFSSPPQTRLASVCGSAAALRSGCVSLDAPLRLRFTSSARRHADRSPTGSQPRAQSPTMIPVCAIRQRADTAMRTGSIVRRQRRRARILRVVASVPP